MPILENKIIGASGEAPAGSVLSDSLVAQINAMTSEELSSACARLPLDIELAQDAIAQAKAKAASCLVEANEETARYRLGLINEQTWAIRTGELKDEREKALSYAETMANSLASLKLSHKQVVLTSNQRKSIEKERHSDILQSYAETRLEEAEKAAADACALVCTLRSWQARRAYGTELAMMPLGVIENLLIRRLGGIQGINGVAEFAGDLAAQVIAEAPAQVEPAQVEPAQVEPASVATENMETGQ